MTTTTNKLQRKEIKIDNTLHRKNPSDKYKELLDEYRRLHCQSKDMFNGRSLVKFVDIIKSFLENRESKTLLDYGCGKGFLYTNKFHTVTDEIDRPLPELWQLEDYYLFDPGYPEHEKLPSGKFDAVICTDVLEHLPETDLMWIIDEILSYANKMVFINVACLKALKTLSTGENAHISIFHYYDWLELMAARLMHFKHLSLYVFFDMYDGNNKVVEKGFKMTFSGDDLRAIELQSKEKE
jgi:SAM-dependent methyltransferase